MDEKCCSERWDERRGDAWKAAQTSRRCQNCRIFVFSRTKQESPGLSCSKICIPNVKKTKKTVLPSTPLRRYFTLVEHFHILAQIPQVQTGSAAKNRPSCSSVALVFYFFLFICKVKRRCVLAKERKPSTRQ